MVKAGSIIRVLCSCCRKTLKKRVISGCGCGYLGVLGTPQISSCKHMADHTVKKGVGCRARLQQSFGTMLASCILVLVLLPVNCFRAERARTENNRQVAGCVSPLIMAQQRAKAKKTRNPPPNTEKRIPPLTLVFPRLRRDSFGAPSSSTKTRLA